MHNLTTTYTHNFICMCTSTRAFRKGPRAEGRDREWAPCTCIYSCINILGRRIRFDRWDPRGTETETEMDRLPRRGAKRSPHMKVSMKAL